jgi:very-short-patch-repair endonuclease
MKSAIEESFAMQVRACKLPTPEREYRFHPARKWRADFAWPERKLLVECEGATWVRGRHTRGSGYAADLEKYNAASMLGYTLLRFTADMVKSGVAIVTVQRALA